MNEMNTRHGRNKLLPQDLCSGYPLSFLKCANGTLLPLTLGSPFARIKSSPGKTFATMPREADLLMSGRIVVPPLAEERNRAVLPMAYVSGLLDKVEKALLVAERNGDLVLVNLRAKQLLGSYGLSKTPGLNLFTDLLLAESNKIFAQIESGAHEVELQIERGGIESTAQIQWMPEPDWLVVELENKSQTQAQDPATQLTIQELLQEREITYRNLLAAYLKLQEVNRQKTVFLASAAHE